MRTCRYKFRITPADTPDRNWRRSRAEEHAKTWSTFVATCRSLDRDGFDFSITVKLINGFVVVIIAGQAGPAVPRKVRPSRVSIIPAKVTPEKCRKMAEQQKRLAIRDGILPPKPRITPKWWGVEDRREDARRLRRDGRRVARAIARGESYVTHPEHDDALRHWPVTSTITEAKQSAWFRHGHAPPEAGTESDESRVLRLAALAEYKYWREMELLAGQRDKWKPGIVDAIANECADDEVAA